MVCMEHLSNCLYLAKNGVGGSCLLYLASMNPFPRLANNTVASRRVCPRQRQYQQECECIFQRMHFYVYLLCLLLRQA
jgi:hypothetical protein